MTNCTDRCHNIGEYGIHDLICPISLKMMKNPVKTVNGFTYEQKYISRWFKKGNCIEPMTGELISDFTLSNNMLLYDKVRTCTVCRTISEKQLLCNNCKRICYCSRHCQKQDWRQHKNVCQNH